jgi:aminoglycoside phosphotransferase (APT) family kinase protein
MTLFGADIAANAARRARLAGWLAPLLGRQVDADSLRERRPTGGGWSNDTVIIEVAADVAVVLRMQPDGPAMFPDYDLTREHRVLSLLSTQPSVPTPPLVGADLDGTLLGRPLIATKFVLGHIPADDRPSFAEAGWLHDAPPTTQRRFHEQLIATIAALHRLPVKPFADALGEPVPRSLVPSLDALERVWHWDRGERWPAVIDAAFTRLRSSMPSIDVTCPLWGDARPANVIVADDFSTPKALLDWELASVGPPELDVLWLLEMNRMRTVGAGVRTLPGFLDDSASILHYEHISRRRLRELPWYRSFNALKMAVLMHRFLRVSVLRGKLEAQHRVLGDTVASRRVAELLQAS